MGKTSGKQIDREFNAQLAARGFRFTPKRECVYGILTQTRDHPTAERVFLRAKRTMPDISMATVYNCLDALVQCQLVREVNLNRGATRYCPNMGDHLHFACDQCGGVYDIEYDKRPKEGDFGLPKGFRATGYEVAIHGFCATCGSQRTKTKTTRNGKKN